ncbi:polysaccharide biosynthesis tyrosine autokinase [Actinoplanes sp. KI2]|uniref:polysaccharide biosynthesis tyrosine autokinase n=1 Tax=Actinoplanes sp. KI2 TaxID=2983315 RepID=UPI0021D60951|nr:polysaccharide biosynthesis tyrosine autokinase [Actinoplanes sp. KI2]MCU7722681.1 polysaccharide biosynthesis tyrosine autokinase [Actinoplanes sp. KI2]
MELRDYLRVLRRQWWVLAVAVLFALGLTQLINRRTPPEYQATATFFLSSNGGQSVSILDGAKFVAARLATYTELITSDRMAEEIADSVNTGTTPAAVKNSIGVITSVDSALLTITVTDRSPQRAQMVAQALIKLFPETVKTLEARPAPLEPAAVAVPIDPVARVGTTPVSPRPLHNDALAVAVGLLLGAAAAVVREVFDNSIRDAVKLPDLTGAPVLALIPTDPKARKKNGPFISESRSPRAEALRQLRTNIQYAGRSAKILAVSSAMPGEGRSSTACGLAILFAEAGQRVLIVDASLRRPRLAAFLGRDGTPGLTTVLVGAATLDQVLQPWGTGLWLLAAGHQPANPSELLDSPRMAELIDELRGRFDKIILDSPPLLPVTDGAVVAARADGTILLVRARKTTAAQVTAAMRALAAVDAKMLGTVFTMVAAPRRRSGLPAGAGPPGPASPPAGTAAGGWNAVTLRSAA